MKQTTQSTYDNFDTQILNTLNIRILNSGSLLTKTPPKKFSVLFILPLGGWGDLVSLNPSSFIFYPRTIEHIHAYISWWFVLKVLE